MDMTGEYTIPAPRERVWEVIVPELVFEPAP